MGRTRQPRGRRRGLHRGAAPAAAVLLALAPLGVHGTEAYFTSRTDAGQLSIRTGTVDLAVPPPGASNRITVGASGMLPGDVEERAVDLMNVGSLALASITLTTTATASSALDSDTVQGLQLRVDRCSIAWTESGPPSGYTYNCPGTTSTVLADRPAVVTGSALTNLTSTATGATDHLRFTLSLPVTAGNSFAHLSSTLSFALTAAGA